MTPDTVTEWGSYDAYEDGVIAVLGGDAVARLDTEAKRHMSGRHRTARRFYDNFMTQVCRSAT